MYDLQGGSLTSVVLSTRSHAVCVMPVLPHGRPKVGFLYFVLLSISAAEQPDIRIYSENTDDFATGVPFNQWLRHVVIEIPPPPGGARASVCVGQGFFWRVSLTVLRA